MQMKTNKNGVKLLAAVMVFAMAFAGIFVAINGEATDAADVETPAAINTQDLLEKAIGDAKDGDTITIGDDITINKPVPIDKKITINTGNFSLVIDKTGSLVVGSEKSVTITNSTGSSKNLLIINQDTSSKSNIAIELGNKSVLEIKHVGTSTSAVQAVGGPSTVTLASGSELKYTGTAGAQGLNYVLEDAKITATAMSDAQPLAGYFTLGGKSTINANDIGICAADLTGTSVINADTVFVWNKSNATASNYVSSKNKYTELGTISIGDGCFINADNITYGISKTTGIGTSSVTFTGEGSLAGDIELVNNKAIVVGKNADTGKDITVTATFGVVLNGVKYTGVVSNVDVNGQNSVSFTDFVATSENGVNLSAGSVVINGTEVTATNGKIVVSSGNVVINGSIDKGVTLVIEENATVLGDSDITIKAGATMEVYGTVAASTGANKITNDGKLVITPTSNYSAKTEGDGSIVQDADMNVPFYIGGELEKSMELGNATLNDALHIPEGKVLTVDGNLFLNGKDIVVDGELVITKNGCIYEIGNNEGKIVISAGTITNNGIIGNAKAVTVAYGTKDSNVDVVSMQGVAGVNFTVKKTSAGVDVIVSGDLTRISAVEKNEITICEGVTIGDLTVAKKVTLKVDDVKTAANSTVTINGNIASADSTKKISLGLASTFIMNGVSDGTVTISAATGLLKDNVSFETDAKKLVEITPGNNVTGFTITTKKVAVAEGSTTKYYMRAYINGTLDKVITPNHVVDDIPDTSETVVISGEFYVAADETITVSKDAVISAGTGFKANIAGSIVIADKDLDDKYFESGEYVGASYAITTGTAPNTATTLYYTTFSAAIAIIGDVDEKTIESTVDKVEANFTVKADETVKFTGVTVTSKAVVTVETDGTVEKITTVEGMVVVKDGATCTIPTAGYAAKSVSADNTTTYAGLKIAIENAAEGDSIVISSGETKESLTIPAGVIVTVSNDLKVGGDLTVSEGASLIIKGSLTMTNSDKDVTAQVIGTLDVSEGTYDQGAKSTLKSTGTTVFNNTVDTTALRFSGAYYNNASGDLVITTVANAVNGAFAAAQTNVNVKGTVNESGEIILKDLEMVIDASSNVKLGTITLDGKASVIATGAALTATIVGMNGDGDKAVSSSVKISESNVTVAHEETVKADDSVSHKFTVSDVKGTVTIASGNVNFANDVSVSDVKDKLVVADGATLTLDKDLTVNGGSFVVDGTVVVSGKTLTLNNDKAEINGTVEVTKAGTISLTKAVINGTIDVKVEKDKDNQVVIAKDGFKFGKAATSIGADAKIIGKVVFDDDAQNTVNYIIAYPGIDLSQAVINPDATTGESGVVSTVYSINGVEYATVYANEESTKINDAIKLEMIEGIKGLNFTGITAISWMNVQGEEVGNNAYVGDVDAVQIDIPVSEQKVIVSVGTGISLYIDGVKYNSGSEPSLTVGEHKVTATVNPGYKGTVDIMVNGVKITNGVFTVALGINTVVSATGDITIDSGDTPVTPVQPTEKDDGMGITDYLLIVLVILAAILVVIVAIRMMRS